MTFSLLAYDARTEAWGGVAATGNLCVGGWVLRGRPHCGISASQGQSPSTLWGDDVLDLQRGGMSAPDAVAQVTAGDEGRDHRQISAIDTEGRAAAFSGPCNRAYCGHLVHDDLVVAGNILAGPAVLDAMIEAFRIDNGPFAERLIASLEAAQQVGGDARGTQSAALLCVSAHLPILSLRIDFSGQPIADLRSLYRKTLDPDYLSWLETVPTSSDPRRFPSDTAGT